CYDAKSLWLLACQEGIRPQGLAGDALLGAYLLDPQAGNYTLARIVQEQLGWELAPETGRAVLPAAVAAQGVVSLLHLQQPLAQKLTEAGLTSLYQTVELPLIPVLATMEGAGIKVEPAFLKQMAIELDQELNRLQLAIFDLAGDSFNINSPRQLGGILFEKLGLPVIKKTKTGYSTDVEVLDELADCHPIIGKVLEYRQLMKLKSTYVEGILPLLDPRDGRIHTTFNQMVTATGRLSSTEPNLQNIPVRLEQGRRIRRAFVVPGDGWLLLAADYSQIELRILAHLSGDPGLKEAFINQQDIHTRTASEVFGVAMSAVTPEMRHRAKAVNFGIVYGIGDFRLSRDLGVSRAEARRYIDGYFARYAGVKRYIDQTITLARKTGVVTTLLGRHRRIPELFAKNKVRQAFGERAAMNTPVQGSAADIIKAAMVNIAALLRDKGFQARMLLQVHDELIFEIPRAELPHLAPRIKAAMEQAVPLDIPLVVDLKTGSNWYEMNAYKGCL
ncbi:MAG: DNA polymerase I, partial [Heliobacteriaceae bacterium]|nr:DNA polymerase I [Heliobacteriaceae bacterium]